MISLLKKIYEQNEFVINEGNDKLLFSEKENQEYYITLEYDLTEIENFFECKKTNNLISFYQNIKKKSADIEKNTSLIVCIKVDNIEDAHKKNKNIIYKIEEDEYFFRKYIILYTENSIKNIDISENIIEQLELIIKKDNMIENYQKDPYKSEEFFLAIQLYVKCPFLVFKVDTNPFMSLQEQIKKMILKDDLNNEYSKILSFEDNFIESKQNEYFEKLTDVFLSENIENQLLNDFFDHFEEM